MARLPTAYYLSFCAGICSIAEPLHGLANQEELIFMEKVVKAVDLDATNDFVWSLLKFLDTVTQF